jgi:hypothetical protein
MSEEHLETPLALPAWAERAIEARAEVERLRARVAELEEALRESRREIFGLADSIPADPGCEALRLIDEVLSGAASHPVQSA